MKANFLPQQLVSLFWRVYINGQPLTQAIASSYIVVIALLTVIAWGKPALNPVEHISFYPVVEDRAIRPLDKTSRTKVAQIAKIQTKSAAAPVKTSSNLGKGFELIKACESGGNYQAVNSAGYYGAYQFDAGTWNSTAQSAGRSDLVGVRPDKASPADQDAMAKHLHSQRGWQPWGCAYHVGLI